MPLSAAETDTESLVHHRSPVGITLDGFHHRILSFLELTLTPYMDMPSPSLYANASAKITSCAGCLVHHDGGFHIAVLLARELAALSAHTHGIHGFNNVSLHSGAAGLKER